MKLTALVFVTLDGVYQGPGGPDEDRRGGFDRGGWLEPHSDEVSGAFVRSAYENADALLLGRTTWQIWEPYWPLHAEDAGSVGRIINEVPKYVPSTTLTDPSWQGTEVIADDVEGRVRALKAQPGRDLLLQGSGKLLAWLLERDLVDELDLMIYPVVLGTGLRLFPDGGSAHALELLESRSTPGGVTIGRYRPAGRPTFAVATP